MIKDKFEKWKVVSEWVLQQQVAKPEKQRVFRWKADGLWEKFTDKSSITWQEFKAHLIPNPAHDLVYDHYGRKVINLKRRHTRGFKYLFKYYSSKELTQGELSIEREQFIKVLSYFEPIVHISGCYSDGFTNDGFTLAHINSMLSNARFVPDEVLHPTFDVPPGSQTIVTRRDKPSDYRFVLGPNNFTFIMIQPDGRTDTIIRRNNPIGLSFEKLRHKKFRTFDEIELNIKTDSNFAKEFLPRRLDLKERKVEPLDEEENKLLTLLQSHSFGVQEFQALVEDYYEDTQPGVLNVLFQHNLRKTKYKDKDVSGLIKDAQQYLQNFEEIIDVQKMDDWYAKKKIIEGLQHLVNARIIFYQSGDTKPVVRDRLSFLFFKKYFPLILERFNSET